MRDRLKYAWRVYFDQVNQSRWDVEAATRDEAIEEAKKMWRESYGQPTGTHVEGGEEIAK